MSAQPQLYAAILDDCFALDDIEMEVKYSVPKQCRNMPALIFIHGSFHSSWCFEHYLQYFANIGYPCVALSLRGTSKTISYKTDKNRVVSNKVKIDQHVHDVLSFLEYISGRVHYQKKNTGKQDNTMRLFFESLPELNKYIAPIVLGHSFGGLTIMKLLERIHEAENRVPILSTVALLCSVPPSGITKMSMRAMRRNPIKGWRIMRGLAMKRAVADEELCRLLFFDKECSDEQLKKYMAHFREDSKVTIDLKDFADKLPILAASDGHSINIPHDMLQPLVVGGSDDYIVDFDAIQETAKFLSSDSTKSNCVMVQGAVHDVMLASCWLDVATQIDLWLSSIVGLPENGEIACLRYQMHSVE